MKTIVTHFAPDLDAITSVWLLKKFLPGWSEADIKFVSAGKTLNDEIVDSDQNILHVDTGLGILDHHQTTEDTCAAKRTMEYIMKTQNSKCKTQNVHTMKNNFPDEALERLIEVVNDIDHFREVDLSNPACDYYDFGLVSAIDGLKLLYPDQGEKIISFGMTAMDGIYKNFQNKVWAEKEIAGNGMEFKIGKEKGIGIETVNDEIIRLSQKQGFILSLRKDPKKGYVRIKARPGSKIDLEVCYNMFRKKDPGATWYLHQSHKMILNGSTKNPDCKPTSLSLKEIIEVLKSGIKV